MRLVLTLVARDRAALDEALPPALEAVAAGGRTVDETRVLGEGAMDLFVEDGDLAALRARAARALERQAADF
nr:hypothetical protein [Caulobacteraceae bacterium]